MATKRFFCNSGSPDRLIYEPFIDSNGCRKLRVVGKESLHDYIQSFKQSTDINVILKRFESGDISALNCNTPMYGDFTKAPRSLADFLNLQQSYIRLFESLPVDVRNTFDQNVNRFMAEAGSESWLATMQPYLSNSTKPEVNTDES